MEYREQGVPQIVIIEQPQPRSLRFRYNCENRGSSFSPILGMTSSESRRSYPTVEIIGFQGRAKIVVHCVTTGTPPAHHPHKLVGQNCQDGVCVGYIGPKNDMRFSLSNIGIQCVRRQDVDEELKARFNNYSNPFIAFSDDPSSINVNSLCLCFQAFLETEPNQFDYILPPAISHVIFDKKSNPDLKICHLSDSEAPASGGKKIILVCEKVDKNDIAVRFFKNTSPHSTWEAYGSFSSQDVHKQVALAFLTPAYYDLTITNPVQVYVQLQQPSNSLLSKPIKFTFHPINNARSADSPSQPPKGLPSFQCLRHQMKISQPNNFFDVNGDPNKSFEAQQDETNNQLDNNQSTVNTSDQHKFTIPMQNFHIQWKPNDFSGWENYSDDNSYSDSVSADYSEVDTAENYNIDDLLLCLSSVPKCSRVSLEETSSRGEISTSEIEQQELHFDQQRAESSASWVSSDSLAML